jgi:hypothetical protein
MKKLTGETYFVKPIIHPITKEYNISAEKLYNDACLMVGSQLTSDISRLILNNIDHTGRKMDMKSINEVYTWVESVYRQLELSDI